MKFAIIIGLILGLSSAWAEKTYERFYFNDLRAPKSEKDLMAIQKALQSALPAARAATVGIRMAQGSGSGVIVSEEGLILTAAHVSGGVDRDLTVIMEDGTEYEAVSLGLVSTTDCAMMKITKKGKYPFAVIDRKSEAHLGDWVFAMGHPGGYDKERGSVVRLGRLVKIQDSTIQSDCKLIGGDSGGPIFDMHGRLIGINSRVGQVVEQSMHAPMNQYIEHWEAMLNNEFIGEGPFAKKPEKGKALIGVALEEIKDESGLLIKRVGKGSGGDKAGLKEGDVLLKADDKELTERSVLDEIMKEKTPGDQLKLEYRRGEKVETANVKLGERP